MEKEFLKFLTMLNKPLHYFLIGLCLVIWNYIIEKEPTYLLLLGIILLLLSLASTIEFIIKKIKVHLRKNKIKKHKEESSIKEKEQLKSDVNRIIDEYEKLKGKEKEIINYCIKNNSRVFQQPELCFESYSEAITSLIAKGFANGKASNALRFVIDEVAFIVLDKFINEKNDNNNNTMEEAENEPK